MTTSNHRRIVAQVADSSTSSGYASNAFSIQQAATLPPGAIVVDDGGAGTPGSSFNHIVYNNTWTFWGPHNDATHFGGGMHFTYNTDIPPLPVDGATWETPVLTESGAYQIWAYVPLYHAHTTGATYCIGYSCDGTPSYIVNQLASRGHWVQLGTYSYTAGERGAVYLDDIVPEVWDHYATQIGYDAIVWLPPGVTWSPSATLIPYDARWSNLGLRRWMGYGLEPVATGLGSFYTQHQDLQVPGRKLDVNFTRAYNSLDNRVGEFGLGWSYSYGTSAIDRGDGSIIVTFGDGRAGLYQPDGSGGYTAPDGFFPQLATSGGQLVLTDVDQTVYRFNTDGTLASITEPNGNQLTFARDKNGYTLTDTVGRTFRADLNGDGFIQKITDPIGRVYSYQYDGNKLVAFTDPMTGTIRYTYNAAGLIESLTDANNHTFATNFYDGQGRVIQQLDASGNASTLAYQDSPRVTTITDNEGRVTVHEFDDQYRLIRETDALNNSMVYGYDADSNRNYVKDRTGDETFMEYDDRGNLLEVQDALNGVTEYEYDNRNNLTLERNAAGEETSYTYDVKNNLTNIHDAENGNTVLSYDGQGQLVSVLDANQHLTQFTYDSQGNVKLARDPLNNVTVYTYDGVSRRLFMTDANNHTVGFIYDNNDRVTQLTDAKGKSTVFTYDPVGNLLSMRDRRGFVTGYRYNENDNLVEVTDPRNGITRYTYDRQYNRTSVTNPRTYTTQYVYNEVYDLAKVVDAKNQVTQFKYDADHNLTRHIDALNHSTVYEYDPLDRLTQVTDALNGITKYDYDPVGRRLLTVDARNGQTHYDYDRLGRLVEVIDALNHSTKFTYDAVGNNTSVTNARGFTTSLRYDDANRLLEQQDSLGILAKYSYDGAGNVLAHTDARGFTTRFEYDANDNLQRVIDALDGTSSFTYDEEENRLSHTDANNHTRVFTYDEVGNQKSVKLPLGQVTSYSYDPNGNLSSVKNAKNNVTNFTYNELDQLSASTTALGFVTQYEYDPIGRMTRKTDAENHSTQYKYDALGRLQEVINALNGRTKYEYDQLGYLTAQVDANTHRTGFDVDLLGQVKSETDPLNRVWRYDYDPVGNPIARTDAKGVLTRYTYDARNRLTLTDYPSGADVNFTYDENGNLIALTDISGAASHKYDPLNRLTESKRTAGILAGRSLAYKYDAVGNRLRLTYPDGKAVSYVYDDNDWLKSATDPMAGVTSYKYDDVGLPTNMQNPNKTWTDYGYDNDDRLVRLFNGKPEASSNLVSSFDYTLDRVGNRVRTIERETRGQVITWDKRYTYDALYRLNQSVFTPDYRPAQVLNSTFVYDAVGNRRSMTTNISDKPNTPALPGPVTTGYTYDAADQLRTAGSTRFEYDVNGNRVSMAGPERAINYSFDFENRLRGATTYDVQRSGRQQYDSTLDFTYDGLGRRLERGVIDNGRRKIADFLYDGLGYDMLAQYVDPGEPRTTYYYRDLSQVLSRHEIQGNGKGLQYFHQYDGSTNVSAWTNQAGREVQEYTYAPFGRLIDNNGPDNASNRTDPHNNLTWSGKPWDKETELYHFGARDYDPTTGTWLTQDPYRGQLMEPATRHRYQYALNNPATLVDLYGFASTDKYYISPDVFKDIKLQGPIMDQNLMNGTQPYGGGMTGLYTTSSSQLYQQPDSKLSLAGSFPTLSSHLYQHSRNVFRRAGTQHSPLLKSLNGGTYRMTVVPPDSILHAIRDAEGNWEWSLPLVGEKGNRLEGLIGQKASDIVGWFLPQVIVSGEYSVGRYNIEPARVADALKWANEQGIAGQFGVNPTMSEERIVRALVNPSQDDKMAALVLAHARSHHPDLRGQSWEEIAADDMDVALLYSGYIDDTQAWRDATVAGEISLERLGCVISPIGPSECTVVQQNRP